jgi:hypothetical protein
MTRSLLYINGTMETLKGNLIVTFMLQTSEWKTDKRHTTTFLVFIFVF